MGERDRHCPRDHAVLAKRVVEGATLDICGACGGQFFDSGEMFRSFGVRADPSYWDRLETRGAPRTASEIACSRCGTEMVVQDVTFEGDHVRIDRCAACGALWLDAGEIDAILAIGEKLQPVVDAETARAKEDVDTHLMNVQFAPGLISRFLTRFRVPPAEPRGE